MDTYCGPHHNSHGKRLARRKRIIIRSAGDHVSGEPIAVFDQSKARMRSPISPPPMSHSARGPVLDTDTPEQRGLMPPQSELMQQPEISSYGGSDGPSIASSCGFSLQHVGDRGRWPFHHFCSAYKKGTKAPSFVW